MNPIYPNPATAELIATANRRIQLPNEVIAIKDLLTPAYYSDELSLSLRTWLEHLSVSLCREHANRGAVLEAYKIQLADLLRDPVTRQPLDETALLGSDGRTYTLRTIEMHAAVPEEFRDRSPLDPANPDRFTTAPHPILPEFLRLARLLNVLEDQPVRAVPNRVQDMAARAERIAARNLRRAEQRDANLRQFQAELQQVQEQNGQFREALFAPIAVQFQRDQEAVGERLDREEELFRNQLNQLHQLVEEHEAQVLELREGNRLLQEMLDREGDQISELQRADIQLQMDINSCKEAIEKQKNAWVKDLLTAALIIGVCIFATWAINSLIAASSTAGAGAASAAGAGAGGAAATSTGAAGVSSAPRFGMTITPVRNGAGAGAYWRF